MTHGDKQLLFKDLCARLPYGVKYQDRIEGGIHILSLGIIHHYERFIPYLRPMSSMTEEERFVYEQRLHDVGRSIDVIDADDVVSHIDWLNAHHFDFRGLIPMGLAWEAPEGMYETK